LQRMWVIFRHIFLMRTGTRTPRNYAYSIISFGFRRFRQNLGQGAWRG
jgi:hypothetical protein